MTRKQILAAAGAALGQPVPDYRFNYCLRRGHLPKPERRPDGWNVYGPDHVEALIQFCQSRAGRCRGSAIQASV